MIALIIVSASVAVLLTVWLCAAPPRPGTPSPTGSRRAVPSRGKEVVCDGSDVHRIRFRRTGLPGSAVAAPVRGATVLPLAAGLLRRLIRLIGGSR